MASREATMDNDFDKRLAGRVSGIHYGDFDAVSALATELSDLAVGRDAGVALITDHGDSLAVAVAVGEFHAAARLLWEARSHGLANAVRHFEAVLDLRRATMAQAAWQRLRDLCRHLSGPATQRAVADRCEDCAAAIVDAMIAAKPDGSAETGAEIRETHVSVHVARRRVA